jgi:hypothetical protein
MSYAQARIPRSIGIFRVQKAPLDLSVLKGCKGNKVLKGCQGSRVPKVNKVFKASKVHRASVGWK